MKEPRSIIPVIAAAILLLLPMFYVSSYAALVKPSEPIPLWSVRANHYRIGGSSAARFYWPLEQVDRRLRPRSWEPRQAIVY